MNKYNYLILCLLMFAALSCERVPDTENDTGEIPVLFSMDTKSLGLEEATYRVALFNRITQNYIAHGTYCSDIIHHEATLGAGGAWLSPCRVFDSTGMPRKSDANGGGEAAGLSEADKDPKYGLRVSANSSAYLVVASPAVAFSSDGSKRYYLWPPATSLYISEPHPVYIQGSWIDGNYVYPASTNIPLFDMRARLYVHIECDKLNTAYIQTVTLRNCITSGRWYPATGFSMEHATLEDIVLFDYQTDNAGNVLNLVKNVNTWTSTMEVIIPPIDFGAIAPECRPVIEVVMGENPAHHPVTAKVTISEAASPQTNYTYNLYVSKANIVLSLATSPWDDEGTISSIDEDPGRIGTVNIDGWTENPESGTTTTDWNEGS